MKYSRLQRAMQSEENPIDQRASGTASAFGSMIRGRRKALKMRRFLIELEAGKPSCQLGRSLLVAEALGFTAVDFLARPDPSATAAAPDLPDLPEAMEEPDGRSAGIF